MHHHQKAFSADLRLPARWSTTCSLVLACTRNISSSYHTYPNIWTCSEGGTNDLQFCYTLQNHADTASDDGLGLLRTLNDCCDRGVGGHSLEPSNKLKCSH